MWSGCLWIRDYFGLHYTSGLVDWDAKTDFQPSTCHSSVVSSFTSAAATYIRVVIVSVHETFAFPHNRIVLLCVGQVL